MSDSLDLMRKLIEYRQQKALHHQLMKAAECSMLGIDAIVMLYHFAKVCSGDILEIGSYIGGATIAMAMGVRDSGAQKKIISIERGCRVEHPRVGTQDSFKDLKKNLKRFGFADQVTLINGRSFDPQTVAAVRQMCGPRQIGLFVFDADANVRRDIDCYADRFADRCWMAIDDYLGGANKSERLRVQVDELVDAGRLEPLGFYGFGTWVGRWLGH
ncbi:MAG: class I SAM-dependent methyltransferase [Chthoniobacterales bacterium]|nr:class I SAM-dependent methyltransferase [Chthoniobacterales bacterium]